MKILVLNGSPKRDKSDTMHISRAFLDGMKESAPQDVHIIHTVDQHIEYCTGCFSCMRNGGTCIHNDDMKAILEEILDSDLLLFNFPLYCYGMPASLKALMDRTLPLSSMAMQKVGDRYEHVGQAGLYQHMTFKEMDPDFADRLRKSLLGGMRVRQNCLTYANIQYIALF